MLAGLLLNLPPRKQQPQGPRRFKPLEHDRFINLGCFCLIPDFAVEFEVTDEISENEILALLLALDL